MLWPYQAPNIEAHAVSIRRSGRDITLSLSPGSDLSLERLDHLRVHADMWRICDDLWDSWDQVAANFARFARWAPFASERGWPDGDMLPLGRIGVRAERGEPRDDRLTPDERVSLMTLWAIARSALMIGGDLPSTSPATIALFQNAEVLAVIRQSSRNREVFREGQLVLWAADGSDGERYAAAFNLGEAPKDVVLDAANVDFPAGGVVTELWTGHEVALEQVAEQSDTARGVAPGSAALRLVLPTHGAALLRWRSA